MAIPPRSRTLAEIKAKLLNPATTSHFQVNIGKPTDDGSFQKFLSETGAFNDQDRLNLLCSDASLPGSQFATAEITNDFTGVTEIRPGNFIFYDISQNSIGSCTMDQIAVCLAVPAVAVHPEERKVVVHGGAVHLSKDHIAMDDGSKNFGQVVKLNIQGWGQQLTDWSV